MNDLQLSDDLNVITAEINSYKQVAGQSIFEIGKRLKHVKENDLVHGEFGKWLENIDMNHRQANRFMKIAEEIPNSTTLPNLGETALYLIATMPEEERNEQHEIPSTGETKTVDEMTVKELREVKKQLKEAEQAKQQAEQQAEQYKQSEQIALKQLKEAENKEPEVITHEVTKEVIPEHIKKQMKEKDRVLESAKNEMESMQREIKKLQMQTSGMGEQKKKERELKAMHVEANKTVLATKIKIDEFLKEVAITAFRRGAIASSSDGTKQKLTQGIDELKNFIKEMEMALNGRIEA